MIKQRGGRPGVFPAFCFTATIEFWSTPLVFLESGNLMQQPLATFQFGLNHCIIDFRKNECSRKAMLARHSSNHSLGQSKGRMKVWL